MRRPHSYHPQAHDAARVLGSQIAQARRRRRMPAEELCERAQISPVTLRSVERGALTVAIGIYFSTASVLGIPLFGRGPDELRTLREREEDRLRLLPSRVYDVGAPEADNDF